MVLIINLIHRNKIAKLKLSTELSDLTKIMPRLFLEYLSSKKIYQCKKCHTHFVDRKNLVSKVSYRNTLPRDPTRV